jgi:phosphohistidine phosphatase
MKTLYIVRHAKTNKAILDKDRELLPLGIERTQQLGNYLTTNKYQVDMMYSSSAKRAVQTATILADNLHYPKEDIITKDELYLTSQEEYFNILVEQSDSVDSLMIIGHNPEITNVAQFFVPDFTSYMQTGACFCFDFKTDSWTTIFTAEREVRFYVRFR